MTPAAPAGARKHPAIGPILDVIRVGLSDEDVCFTGHGSELYGRLDHSLGFFFKGYAGLGALVSGNLQDEDFFPGFFGGYSITKKDQRDGKPRYPPAGSGLGRLGN